MTNAKRLELIKANYPKYREGLLNGEVDTYTPMARKLQLTRSATKRLMLYYHQGVSNETLLSLLSKSPTVLWADWSDECVDEEYPQVQVSRIR